MPGGAGFSSIDSIIITILEYTSNNILYIYIYILDFTPLEFRAFPIGNGNSSECIPGWIYVDFLLNDAQKSWRLFYMVPFSPSWHLYIFPAFDVAIRKHWDVHHLLNNHHLTESRQTTREVSYHGYSSTGHEKDHRVGIICSVPVIYLECQSFWAIPALQPEVLDWWWRLAVYEIPRDHRKCNQLINNCTLIIGDVWWWRSLEWCSQTNSRRRSFL